MKTLKLIIASLLIATSSYAVAVNTSSKTVDVSRVTGNKDSFSFNWIGQNDQDVVLTFATGMTNGYPSGYLSLAGSYVAARLSKRGVVYVDILPANVTVGSYSASFSVARTNIPPDDQYDAEVWAYTGATNNARTIAQGKVQISHSLYSDTNSFPFPTNATDLAAYLTIASAAATYVPKTQLFAGAGTTGLITSATADAGKFLKADGSWGNVTSTGGATVAFLDITGIPRDNVNLNSDLNAVSNGVLAVEALRNTVLSNAANANLNIVSNYLAIAITNNDAVVSNAANVNIGIVSNAAITAANAASNGAIAVITARNYLAIGATQTDSRHVWNVGGKQWILDNNGIDGMAWEVDGTPLMWLQPTQLTMTGTKNFATTFGTITAGGGFFGNAFNLTNFPVSVATTTNLDLHTLATGTSVHGLGTAATNATGAFATAAQGAKADAAITNNYVGNVTIAGRVNAQMAVDTNDLATIGQVNTLLAAFAGNAFFGSETAHPDFTNSLIFSTTNGIASTSAVYTLTSNATNVFRRLATTNTYASGSVVPAGTWVHHKYVVASANGKVQDYSVLKATDGVTTQTIATGSYVFPTTVAEELDSNIVVPRGVVLTPTGAVRYVIEVNMNKIGSGANPTYTYYTGNGYPTRLDTPSLAPSAFATTTYVDAQDALALPKSGGTMSGTLNGGGQVSTNWGTVGGALGRWQIDTNEGLRFSQQPGVAWSSGNTATATPDLALSRISAGILGIGTGVGTSNGTLMVSNIYIHASETAKAQTLMKWGGIVIGDGNTSGDARDAIRSEGFVVAPRFNSMADQYHITSNGPIYLQPNQNAIAKFTSTNIVFTAPIDASGYAMACSSIVVRGTATYTHSDWLPELIMSAPTNGYGNYRFFHYPWTGTGVVDEIVAWSDGSATSTGTVTYAWGLVTQAEGSFVDTYTNTASLVPTDSIVNIPFTNRQMIAVRVSDWTDFVTPSNRLGVSIHVTGN